MKVCKKRWAAGLLLVAAMMGLGTACAAGRGVSIKISCGAVGRELELCREAADAWAASTGTTPPWNQGPTASGS